MHNGAVLDDVQPKGMSLDDLIGPIRNTGANGRDIITEFHFRHGTWTPCDSKVDCDAAPSQLPRTLPITMLKHALQAHQVRYLSS